MILATLRAYKSKIMIGIILAMLAVLGVLVWQNWALIQKAAVLTAQRAQIMEANEQNILTIVALQADILRREKASRERAVEQAKIVSEYQRAIKQRDAQISQMRAQHEEIDAFLSIPVPDAFVEQWMRAKDNYEDGNGVSETADGTDGSE